MNEHIEENKTRWKQGRSEEFWDHQEIEEREQTFLPSEDEIKTKKNGSLTKYNKKYLAFNAR